VSEEDCKKNPLRFELSQEETHKEKNKTNKQTKPHSKLLLLDTGCETKTHGKLAVIITCGCRVGFCFERKIFKRKRI